MPDKAAGIGIWRQHIVADTPCIECGHMMDRPVRGQLTHAGDCRKQRLARQARECKAKKKARRAC